jgi:murein DD-endopeptidase MepM/ murein hydrolase activator NlpD
MNKKGMEFFIWLVVFLSTLVLIMALVILTVKYDVKDAKGITRILGQQQADMFKIYQRGEDARFYVGQSAQLSSKNAVYDLASKESGCGTYLGFSVWSSEQQRCFPNKESLEIKFRGELNKELNGFIKRYNDVFIPQNDFTFTIQQNKQLVIKGTSVSPVQIGFGGPPQLTAAQIDLFFRNRKSPLEGLGQCIVEAEIRTGVPATVTMSVAILESGWGRSGLAGPVCNVNHGNPPDTPSYNLFGFKGSKGTAGGCSWPTKECFTEQDEKAAGDKIISCSLTPSEQDARCEASGKHTCQVKDDFRAYKSPCDSINDFVDLIRDDRYWEGEGRDEGRLDCRPVQDLVNNQEEFVRAVHACGYSTAPGWSDGVLSVLHQITKDTGTEQTVAPSVMQAITTVDERPSLIWPADGPITSCYGTRRLELENFESRAEDWHDAVDVGVVVGSDIKSAADGIVEATCYEWVDSCACSIGDGSCKNPEACRGKCGNYGNYVIVKHSDKLYTRYNHLSKVLVQKNQQVKQGEVIALSGNTGLSGGPHLDFKIYFSNNFASDIGKGSNERNPVCYLPPRPPEEFIGESCNDVDLAGYQFCSIGVKGAKFIPKQKFVQNVYSIPVNFKAQLNYSFDEYAALNESIIRVAEKVTQDCYKQSTIAAFDECVANTAVADKAFSWSVACGSEEEKLVANMIETMLLCSQSNQNGYCSFPIPKMSKEVRIVFKRDELLKKITVSSSVLNETLPQSFPHLVDTSSDGKFILGTCAVVTAIIKNGQAEIIGENCALTKKTSWFYTNQFIFYNQLSPGGKVSLLSFMDPALYQNEKERLQQATLIKRELRLCAQSKYSFTNISNKKESVVYKIAFYAGDAVAPQPVQGVAVTDTLVAEENITIQFTANAEIDMSHYLVYYNESEFSTIDAAKGTAQLGKVKHEQGKTTYAVTFKLPKDGSYYFAVTPVDTSGNENIAVVAKKGTAIDDLNPGPVRKATAAKQQGDAPIFDITVMAPLVNEDKSPLKEQLNYTMYLKEAAPTCSEQSIPSVMTNPVKAFSTQKGDLVLTKETQENHIIRGLELPDRTKSYCLVVIAEDETAEEQVKSSRYSVNSIILVKV